MLGIMIAAVLSMNARNIVTFISIFCHGHAYVMLPRPLTTLAPKHPHIPLWCYREKWTPAITLFRLMIQGRDASLGYQLYCHCNFPVLWSLVLDDPRTFFLLVCKADVRATQIKAIIVSNWHLILVLSIRYSPFFLHSIIKYSPPPHPITFFNPNQSLSKRIRHTRHQT